MPEIPQMKIMTNAKHNGDAFSSLNQKNFVLKFSFYISHIMICDRRIKAEWRVENKTNESTKKASGTIFISLNVLGFSYVPKECDTCDKLEIEQEQPPGLRIHINHIGGM